MTARFIVGDVFDGLATLEDGTVDLVVTSPPFLALRSYLPADHPDKGKEIGSEPTPAAFLDVMLAVTAELRRVLAPHGSICVELGDTYAGSGGAGGDYGENGWREGQETFRQNRGGMGGRPSMVDKATGGHHMGGSGWPLAKSKTLIPELYRIALAYGINPLTGQASPAGRWRVRNVVTWARPNPPVGALGDKWRPATSDVVVACVSDKRYWDDIATRRPFKQDEWSGGNSLQRATNNWEKPVQSEQRQTQAGAPLLDYWEIPLLDGEEPKRYGPGEKLPVEKPRQRQDEPAMSRGGNWDTFRNVESSHPAGAPLLDYWEIPPGGYPGSHYAVFPPALVEPLVKAMAPPKVCRTCGEPSRRIVGDFYYTGSEKDGAAPDGVFSRGGKSVAGLTTKSNAGITRQADTLGWSDCGHNDWRPTLILDPFAGSGTTLAVATGHGHDALGIDLDERNAVLAEQRIGPFLFQRETLEHR